MKMFGIVLILFGILIFYIGYIGSQHQVAQMLRGTSETVATGQAINPSGSGNQNQSTTPPASSNQNQGTPSATPGINVA